MTEDEEKYRTVCRKILELEIVEERGLKATAKLPALREELAALGRVLNAPTREARMEARMKAMGFRKTQRAAK